MATDLLVADFHGRSLNGVITMWMPIFELCRVRCSVESCRVVPWLHKCGAHVVISRDRYNYCARVGSARRFRYQWIAGVQ